MDLVIKIASRCGSRFEADIPATKGTHGGYLAACPDCGERFLLPYQPSVPVMKLK
jgi:DNA-directed RNA polymerase subunit RPC12/RpoP